MTFNLSDSIVLLSRTPLILRSLLDGLPDPWVNNNDGAHTWSPYDIVGHLIHGEKTDWIPRARIILSDQKDKTFVPFDRFAQNEESKGKSIEQLLSEFSKLRAENVEELKAMNITSEKLKMTGIHPELGVATLAQLLATWTAHDLNHIRQMTRVMARNYKEEAGPWRAYMSILQG
ncbi:MAG: DinB family protein [Chitinophagales bacterium]|nr:DinB family protein [Chitinophagales bacterium]